MSGYRKKYLSPREWEAVYAAKGRDAAGLPPPGARTDFSDRSNQHLPVQPMIFGTPVERPEHYEERQRRQRLRLVA